jgi:hypothetical protein
MASGPDGRVELGVLQHCNANIESHEKEGN